MDMRKALLGDWTPWLRDPIDLVRLLPLVGVVVFVAQRNWGDAMLHAVAFAAVMGVRPLLLPRLFDLFWTVAIVFETWTHTLGWYEAVPWMDRLVHFVVPMLGSPVIYIALARADVVPDPKAETQLRHHVGIVVLTFALGVALGGLWEIVEWVMDATLATNWSENNDDTVGDLVADTFGAIAGAVLLLLWTVKGWGSVRRVPGTNAYEETDA